LYQHGRTEGKIFEIEIDTGSVIENMEYVRAAGYRSAATTLHRPIPANFNPMFLPRMNISREYDITDFEAIISGDWDYLAFYQRLREALSRFRRREFPRRAGTRPLTV